MSKTLKVIVSMLIRKGLTAIGTLLIANGLVGFSDSTVANLTEVLAGVVFLVGSFLVSWLRQKAHQNRIVWLETLLNEPKDEAAFQETVRVDMQEPPNQMTLPTDQPTEGKQP